GDGISLKSCHAASWAAGRPSSCAWRLNLQSTTLEDTMKRYLLFVYDVGYDSYSGPKAWETFEGDFDSADEAEAEGKRQCDDGNVPYSSTGEAYQVVDTHTKEIIREGSGEGPEMTGRAPTAEEIARFP